MFKIHIGKTPTDLTENDYIALGEKCDGYSGADIGLIVNDALYAPIRICQSATHFKRVGEDKWEPCKPSLAQTEPNNVREMNLMDLSNEQLQKPRVTAKDFYDSLAKSKPSVGDSDLTKQEKFTEEFGMEG